MNVRVYPIVSSLHEDEFLTKERVNLLSSLSLLTGADIDISSLEELYEGDLALILVESGGSENAFLSVLERLKPPFLFLTYPHNNSLAASMEILAYLKRNRLDGEILHGQVENVASRLQELLQKEKKTYARLGIIGEPSDWLISCRVDPREAKRRLGVELVSIPTEELLRAYEEEKDALEEEEFEGRFSPREISKAMRLYRALSALVESYALQGFTIRCFDLLDSLQTTACLALAKFNDRGIVAACEGDVPALLSMFLVETKLHRPSFQANPSQILLEDGEMIFAHCTLPFSMTTSYALDSHYESGIGVAIKGELPLGPCFLFRLSPDLDSFVLLEAEARENLSRPNLCRTQIRVKVLDDISYFLRNPLGNHHLIVYGNEGESLADFLEGKGLRRLGRAPAKKAIN